MKNAVYEEIYKILGRDLILENPKDKALAYLATPFAFSLAKKFKKTPALIAADLASRFEDHFYFERVEAVNGYLNFRLSKAFLDILIKKALKQPDEFGKGKAKNESFLLEYVSANLTGPLHIGHARGAISGDTSARVARHLDYKFDTEHYVNNAGNQIDLLGPLILSKVKILCLNEELEYPENAYKGEHTDDLAHEAFADFEEDSFTMDNVSNLAFWAKDKMLDLIKQNLVQANTIIDHCVSERSYYNALEDTIRSLKTHDGVCERNYKIWLASSLEGDEKDRVIVRDDGRGTYLAADIVYRKDKMSEGYDKCTNIWGADHHGYIPRMKAAIEFLGSNPQNLEIILAQTVSLLKDNQPYKMSKRVGNFILMSEILDEIGSDVLRFIFLSKKCDTHLEFDIDIPKKEDSSSPTFYINYAHARVKQIFLKVGKSLDGAVEADLSNLNDEATSLLFEALNLGSVLNDAFERRALQKVPDYLKGLAVSFHKFYYENRVIGTENEDSLLKLFALVALNTRTGFILIGIRAKDKMEH